MNSLISIIIPCYNQANYIDECLQSVFDQTYRNWECIIVNDGSLDNTHEIVQRWLQKDSRFKYIYKENEGLSSARNAGLNSSRGDYIQFLDSDDFLDNRKIELSLQRCVEKNYNCNLVISNFRMFTDDVAFSTDPYCELKQEYFSFEEVLFGWDSKFNIPIHCGFFEANLFKDLMFFEELKAKEDWMMWLIIFQKDIHFCFLDIPLALYRMHADNMTKDKKIMENNYFKAVLFLKNIIPSIKYNDYLEYVLKKQNQKIISLENHINNYKKSKGYKILEILKNNNFTLFFIKLFK